MVKVGFLLSNKNTENNIKRHIKSKNPNFVAISLGVNEPNEIVENSFEAAEKFLENFEGFPKTSSKSHLSLKRMKNTINFNYIRELYVKFKSLTNINEWM